MKSYGYTALALLLAVLVVGLVSGVFTQDPWPRIFTVKSDTDSIAALGEPDERRTDSAATGVSPGQDVPDSREGGPSMLPVEGLTAPRQPVDKPAPAYPAVDPDRQNTILGSLLFVIRDYREGPVPGVLIRLRSELGEKTSVSGSSGEVVFDDLRAGSYSYQLQAPRRPELAGASFALAEGEERILELWLGDYNGTIEGHILDQDGDPVGGLTVTARPYHGQADEHSLMPEEQRAQSAPDGWFEFTGLGEGEHELRTLATGRYDSVRTIVRVGTDSAVLLVSEDRALWVLGQVTDPAGQPLAGVDVSLLWGPGRRTRTDEAGQYELSFEDRGFDGRYRFRFEVQGYRPEHLALGPAAPRGEASTRLDAVLEPIEQALEVLAYMMDDRGVPVDGETMHLYSRELNTHYRGIGDAEGEVFFPAVLPSSDYRLSVLPKARYKSFMRSFVDLTGAPPPLEIVLDSLSTGRLRGRMVDVMGEPVPHFSVWLHSDELQGKWIKVTGDGSGQFEVADVPEGRLTLQTRSQPLLRTTGIELAAGSDAYVEVVLDWGEHFLEGQVVDDTGQPLAGARIYLDWLGEAWPVDHQSVRQTIADNAGAFEFSRLGGGPYALRASASGHNTKQLAVEIGAQWVQLQLQASGK